MGVGKKQRKEAYIIKILQKIYNKMMEDDTNSMPTKTKHYTWLLYLMSCSLLTIGGFTSIANINTMENSTPVYSMVLVLLGFMFYIIATLEVIKNYKKRLRELHKNEQR